MNGNVQTPRKVSYINSCQFLLLTIVKAHPGVSNQETKSSIPTRNNRAVQHTKCGWCQVTSWLLPMRATFTDPYHLSKISLKGKSVILSLFKPQTFHVLQTREVFTDQSAEDCDIYVNSYPMLLLLPDLGKKAKNWNTRKSWHTFQIPHEPVYSDKIIA